MTKFIIDNIDFITRLQNVDTDRRFILPLFINGKINRLVWLTLYKLNFVDLVNIQYRKIFTKKKYLNEDG